MFRYQLSLIGLLLLACVLQQFIPVLTGWWNTRLLLMTLVFLCGAVATGTPGMLILAFLGGFLWDAQQSIVLNAGDPMVYEHAPDTLPFGFSIILFAVLGFFMQGVQPVFREGKWQTSIIMVGLALFLYQLIEILTLSFIRGRFLLSNPLLSQISLTALVTTCLSPLVFWIIFRLADLFDHTIQLAPKKSRTSRYE